MVPPSASSKRPCRRCRAPVNAPFSWPNSSEAMSDDGIAAQFTATKARAERGERLWMARAMSSLPVPVSPVISTVRIRRRHLGHVRQNCPKRRRGADDLLEHRRAIDLFAQREVLASDAVFGPLAVVDVGSCRIPADDIAVVVAERAVAGQEPTILSVFPARALLGLKWFAS